MNANLRSSRFPRIPLFLVLVAMFAGCASRPAGNDEGARVTGPTEGQGRSRAEIADHIDRAPRGSLDYMANLSNPGDSVYAYEYAAAKIMGSRDEDRARVAASYEARAIRILLDSSPVDSAGLRQASKNLYRYLQEFEIGDRSYFRVSQALEDIILDPDFRDSFNEALQEDFRGATELTMPYLYRLNMAAYFVKWDNAYGERDASRTTVFGKYVDLIDKMPSLIPFFNVSVCAEKDMDPGLRASLSAFIKEREEFARFSSGRP